MDTRSSGIRRSVLVLGACLVLVVLIGWVDYATGLEASVVILYLLPVVLASWFGSAGAGYAVAVLAAIAWHVAAALANVSYSSPFILYWNAAVQLLVFISTAALADAVRRGRQALESKVEARTASLTVEIAERRRAEDRLRATLTALEERSVQLRALALELTRAEQRERERLATLLHDDLQQLLVAAKVSLSTLDRETSRADGQRRLKGVQDLLDQSVRVTRSLAVQLCPTVLHEAGLVAALRQLAQHMQQTYNLSVEVAADAEVPADAEGVCVAVYQAVRELLFNVVKHADASSAAVRVTHAGPGRTQILVADEGLGFDPENLKGDAGSGLRNTRDRMELLGGSLQVEAAPGKGTRVTILAPLGPPGADGPLAGAGPHAADGPLTADGPLPKIRVLIAEDYEHLRLMLADSLGHEPDIEVVAEAADGEAAVRLAHSLRPDVVLMDVSMPVMDGVQATRRLTAELPGIRVIGLSAYADAVHTEAMRAAGAVACLLKESSAERLADAIRSCAPKPPA